MDDAVDVRGRLGEAGSVREVASVHLVAARGEVPRSGIGARERDHLMIMGAEISGDRGTDEPRGSCHKDAHASSNDLNSLCR